MEDMLMGMLTFWEYVNWGLIASFATCVLLVNWVVVPFVNKKVSFTDGFFTGLISTAFFIVFMLIYYYIQYQNLIQDVAEQFQKLG